MTRSALAAIIVLLSGIAAQPAPRHPIVAGASQAWLAATQHRIDPEAYEVTTNANGVLVAPNLAQRFTTTFADGRFHVAPDGANRGGWQWSLGVSAWGRPGDVEPVVDTPPSFDGARGEYRRSRFGEWFENGPRGLEQGFHLPAPPAGRRGALVIDLRLGGTLHPVFADDGETVDFFGAGHTSVLRYGNPEVREARGEHLPARLRPRPGGIRIEIEDSAAVYPIDVDPLVSNGWFAYGDEDFAVFGIALGTAGDVNGDGYSDAIVGAYIHDGGGGAGANRGRVFVYDGSPSAFGSSPDRFASGGQNDSWFGISVGTAGDVNGDGYSDLVIGAPKAAGGGTKRGAARVYLGNAAGIPYSGWTDYGDADDAEFGYAVATAGDVDGDGYADVAIGAPYHDDAGSRRGRAYVYRGSSSGVAASPVWTGAGAGDEDWFGFTMATAGDIDGDGDSELLVGAYGADSAEADMGAPTCSWARPPVPAPRTTGTPSATTTRRTSATRSAPWVTSTATACPMSWSAHPATRGAAFPEAACSSPRHHLPGPFGVHRDRFRRRGRRRAGPRGEPGRRR